MDEIVVNGQRVEVTHLGVEGRPVVSIGNVLDPGGTWPEAWMPKLEQSGFCAVAVRHRGETNTVEGMAADLAKAIAALGLGPCPVAGYSQGAWVAQELALAAPELVSHAILVATSADHGTFSRALIDAFAELDGLEVPTPAAKQVLMAFELFDPVTLLDDEFMAAILPILGTGVASTAPADRLLAQRSHHASAAYGGRLEALAGIKVPTLVVSFEHDVICPARAGRAVADAIPGASYVEVSSASHAGALTHADEVVAAVLRFLS